MLDTRFICSKLLVGSSCISLHTQGVNDACLPQQKTLFTGSINVVNRPLFKNKAIPDIRFGSGLCSLFKLYFLYLIPTYKLVQLNMNGLTHRSEKCSWCSCREPNGRRSAGSNRQFIRSNNEFTV